MVFWSWNFPPSMILTAVSSTYAVSMSHALPAHGGLAIEQVNLSRTPAVDTVRGLHL